MDFRVDKDMSLCLRMRMNKESNDRMKKHCTSFILPSFFFMLTSSNPCFVRSSKYEVATTGGKSIPHLPFQGK